MKYFLFFFFSVFLTSARAAELPETESTFTFHKAGMEIGGSLGTPALANLLLGFHFPLGKISGFARFSGMYHGETRINGLEADLGVYFDTDAPFFQSAAIEFSVNDLYYPDSLTPEKDYWTYVGLNYTFNIKGFFVKAGISERVGPRAYDRTNNTLFTPSIQVGYTVLLNY